MGNSHGHKKSSSRAKAKRRHSMPALSSTNHSKSEALGTGTAMPAPAAAAPMNDGSSGMLQMSSHHNSTPFSVDPMAAMLAHHDKCRRPSSQMFQKTAAAEEEKREVDVPLFDHYHPRPPLHNDDSYGDISLSFDALDDGDSDQDQDVSFFLEEEPSSPKQQHLMPNTKSASLLGSNNNNGGLYNNLYNNNNNSSSHSSSMRHSSSNHSSSLRQNSSGHTSSTMRSNSMRHPKSSPHFASPLSTVESQEEEKKEIDHSRRRRRGSLMSKQKSKRDKPPPKSRRRASLDSSAYHTQADALLTNLEEVESFLRTLQKKDPEVRQRFLMESLQRQAGMSDSSQRFLLQHNSSMNNSFLSASVSNLHDSSSGTRRMMNDSSTRSLRGDASTTGTTRRRKDKKSKQRRASGLSASASRLQTSGRRASDIALQASSGHGGSFHNPAHILNEELPPLMEQQSAHHRLPKTKTQRQSRRDSDNESKIAAARRSSGVLGLPSLAPMPSSPETKNKPRRRASLSQLPTLEEQKPQQTNKPKYSKHNNNNNNFLKKGFRRLSIGDTSKQALPDPKEYYYLERKNSKRDKPKKSKKNRKSSSLSPARRKDHKSRRPASLSPKRKKTTTSDKKKKSTAVTGKEMINGRTKEAAAAAFGRTKTVDLDYNDATMMDQSDYNHRIKTSGRVPIRTTLQEVGRTRSKSQSRGKSPKNNTSGSRSSRRRRSLAGWIGF